jgi:hypothetical protein
MPYTPPATTGGSLAGDMVPLGGTTLGTAAASTAVVSWAAADYKWLKIYGCVSGYASGGGIFSLQFGVAGGAIDTGARYQWAVHPDTTAAGTAWGTSVLSSTTTAPSMIQLANAAITTGRTMEFMVMNRSGSTLHTCQWVCTNEPTSATAHSLTMTGRGAYISATAGQITSVQMLTNSGGGNLNAGSGFRVYGIPA